MTGRPGSLHNGPRLDGDHNYDPERRLLAAVVLRAVRDYVCSDAKVKPDEQADARRFLWSQAGFELLREFVGSEELVLEEKLRELETIK